MYYPIEIEFIQGERENFDLIDLSDNNKLYFGKWYEEENEENEYYETIVIRNIKGEKLQEINGSLVKMPKGEYWII